MEENNRIQNRKNGMNFMWLALTAFGGLGLEALYAFLLEPMIYGREMTDWNTPQTLIHWTITCITWGLVAWYTVKRAEKECDFFLFKKTEPVKMKQWIAVILCVVYALLTSYLSWGGSKVMIEFQKNGTLKFIFQYIYYLFETVLFMLIIVYGQKAFETWFRRVNIPYGGIVVALTWGIAHCFTKGSLFVGIQAAIGGFCFGVVYLLLNRNIKWTYVILCIMFIL